MVRRGRDASVEKLLSILSGNSFFFFGGLTLHIELFSH